MRRIAVVLTFATATLGVGCGSEEPPPEPLPKPTHAAPIVGGTDVVGESLVATALSPWKTGRPQHFRLTLTHTVQRLQRFWTGDIEDWKRQTAPTPAPLEVEAWVGPEDQAVRSYGDSPRLTYYRSLGSTLSRIHLALDTGSERAWWATPSRGKSASSEGGPVPEVGWAAGRRPTRLGVQLARLLDLSAVAEWLGGVADWSTAMDGVGTAYRAMTRFPHEVEVSVVLATDGRLLRLEVAVRLNPSIVRSMELRERMPLPGLEGPLPRGMEEWPSSLPFLSLELPNEALRSSALNGGPLADDPHERTVFVLTPDPNPPSAELLAFLKAERATR